MEYTSAQRLERIWELVREDPECMECFLEMEGSRQKLEKHTDALPPDAGAIYWALPMTQYTFFHRVLEVVCRQMRLPEERENRPDH